MLGNCSQCNEVVEFDAHMEGGQAECPHCSQAFTCVNDVTEKEFYGGSGGKKTIMIASICSLLAAGAIGGGVVLIKNKGGDVAKNETTETSSDSSADDSTSELANLMSSSNNQPSNRGGNSGGGMDMSMGGMDNSMSMDGGMMSMDGGMMSMEGGMAGGSGSFTGSVLPILQNACTKCHGSSKSKGGLRLHTRNDAMDAVVAGNPNSSELYKRIILSPDHDDVMPPNGNVLSKADQDVIKNWIASGAK